MAGNEISGEKVTIGKSPGVSTVTIKSVKVIVKVSMLEEPKTITQGRAKYGILLTTMVCKYVNVAGAVAQPEIPVNELLHEKRVGVLRLTVTSA